jgi:hypothetical protein
MTKEPQLISQQGARNVSTLHNIQTNYEVHSASYAVGHLGLLAQGIKLTLTSI